MNLLDYDTIIFDLDFTVWNGCRPRFWAKCVEPPYTQYSCEKHYIYGRNGGYIYLQDGVKMVLKKLAENNKNLGYITRGGYKDIFYEDQPPVKCLRLFGIHDFFNHQKSVLTPEDNKSSVFHPIGKTIFIDDDQPYLDDVKRIFPETTCLNRDEFISWTDIIK